MVSRPQSRGHFKLCNLGVPRMKFRTNKWLTAVSVVAFSVAVYGCGSSSDGPVATAPTQPPGPEDPRVPVTCETPSQACVDALAKALMDAEDKVTELKGSDDATQGEIRDAEMAVTSAPMNGARRCRQMELRIYIAMQPPKYDIVALAKAVAAEARTIARRGTFTVRLHEVRTPWSMVAR